MLQRRSVPRVGRRWCIPPAISADAGEHLEGMAILREIESDLGLLLWSACRDVRLWAATPPRHRKGLFTPEAAARRRALLLGTRPSLTLAMPLDVLTGILRDPVTADPEMVSASCLDVVRWAASQNVPGTAVAFAVAAADALPDRGEPALHAGQQALLWGRHVMAETWLRRAIAIARRERNWSVYAWAYVELGSLYAWRGDAMQAQRFFHKGLLASRRHGIRLARAAALRGLARLALRAGDYVGAERHARHAQWAYGRDHADFTDVLADRGVVAVRLGTYARAATMLRAALRAQTRSVERAQLLAALAHAAAGAGDRAGYERDWQTAWDLLTAPGLDREAAIAVLRELNRAAEVASDIPRQRAATERARKTLSERQSEPRSYSLHWRLISDAGHAVPDVP